MTEATTTSAVTTGPAGSDAPTAEARIAQLEADLANARAELVEAHALLVDVAQERERHFAALAELERRMAALGVALDRFELAEAQPASPSVN